MAMVLFVISMTALTTSCTKGKSDLILGKWKFEKAVVSFGNESAQMSASDIAAMMGVDYSEGDLIFEFKSNGTVYAGDQDARYTLDGDKLTVVTPEETFEMTIMTLTDSALVVEPQFEEGMMNGVKAEIHFKRA